YAHPPHVHDRRARRALHPGWRRLARPRRRRVLRAPEPGVPVGMPRGPKQAISLSRLRANVEALSAFGRNPDGRGISRFCWSPPHEEARAWLIARMKGAGPPTWGGAAGHTL